VDPYYWIEADKMASNGVEGVIIQKLTIEERVHHTIITDFLTKQQKFDSSISSKIINENCVNIIKTRSDLIKSKFRIFQILRPP